MRSIFRLVLTNYQKILLATMCERFNFLVTVASKPIIRVQLAITK